MRYARILLSILLCYLTPAVAQLNINFSTPGVSIGIDVPVYPQFERVQGYPVYYAPRMNSNYFFYDGLYWVYNGDNWYASSWYNGPWGLVDPFYVPAYVLRVPVRYYRHAPSYFSGWGANDAPRWGDHWGQSWQQRRSGWDQWNHSSAPAPAPLPTYQKQYSGSRYPQASQQAVIQTQNYRYQPKEAVAQQHFQQQKAQAPAAQAQPAPQAPRTQQAQRPQPPAQAPASREQAPKAQPQSQQAEHRAPQTPAVHEQQATQPKPQQAQRQPAQAPVVHEQQAPQPKPQQAQRQPAPAPVVHEQQAPQPKPQQAQRQPAPAPVAHEQAPKPQPQIAEHRAPQAPAAHEQHAPSPQAQERAPQAKESSQKPDNKEKDSKEPSR